MPLKSYHLFNQWRGIEIFGEDFKDALMRKKSLKRPDRFISPGVKEEGATISIKSIVGELDTSERCSSRGESKIIRMLIEASDGQYFDVDATEKELVFVQ